MYSEAFSPVPLLRKNSVSVHAGSPGTLTSCLAVRGMTDLKNAASGGRRWPHVDRWFDSMETRETYLGLKSDFYTHVHDLPPQLGGAHTSWLWVQQLSHCCPCSNSNYACPPSWGGAPLPWLCSATINNPCRPCTQHLPCQAQLGRCAASSPIASSSPTCGGDLMFVAAASLARRGNTLQAVAARRCKASSRALKQHTVHSRA